MGHRNTEDLREQPYRSAAIVPKKRTAWTGSCMLQISLGPRPRGMVYLGVEKRVGLTVPRAAPDLHAEK
ncbi:hypothetical protein VTN02DRAFT_4487 [Thermoascus thermophilus]